MTTPGPKEVFEQFFPALERLDVGPFVATFDDDVTLRFPYMPAGYPKRFDGRAAAADFFTIVPKLFAEFRWTDRRIYSTDDPEVAIAVATSSATLPNGADYDNEYVFVIRARAGKVIEYWEHFDPARALVALQLATA